jgi:hypothetical protein
MRIAENTDKHFHTSVFLLSTSMNLIVSLLPLERLGLVALWRISYDETAL